MIYMNFHRGSGIFEFAGHEELYKKLSSLVRNVNSLNHDSNLSVDKVM